MEVIEFISPEKRTSTTTHKNMTPSMSKKLPTPKSSQNQSTEGSNKNISRNQGGLVSSGLIELGLAMTEQHTERLSNIDTENIERLCQMATAWNQNASKKLIAIRQNINIIK